jgi:hypothetical protein
VPAQPDRLEEILVRRLNGAVECELDDRLGTADGLHLSAQVGELGRGNALQNSLGVRPAQLAELQHKYECRPHTTIWLKSAQLQHDVGFLNS